MAELVVHPDTRFIQEIVRDGGPDLKKCYQCATCSTVCALSPEDSPFPRRQILQAQWGLKEQVLSDPAIWLCHNCGDCSEHCPRGVRPGDVLGALRQKAIEHFAWPGFLARLINNPKALFVWVLIPVLLFGLQWAIGPEGVSHTGEPEFAQEYPLWLLEALFFTLCGLVVVAFAVSMARFVKALRAAGAREPILSNLVPVIAETLAHRRFAECTAERNRYRGHLLLLWGFVGLAVVGTLIGLGVMGGVVTTPLSQTNPLKIFANLSGLAALAGALILLADRWKNPDKRAHSTYFDWYLIAVLTGVLATGFLSQIFRELEWAAMYPVYFVHLVLVFMLLVYAPYSKLAHLAYRTVALAASSGRR